MTSPPRISVIVPVYNVADHVAACIASLRAQDWTDFEAIVVDDGSTDASPAVLRDAIGHDPRFVVITQENAGLSAARNTGLDHARGAVIAFVDSDDRVDPAYLSALHEALVQSGADWAACAIRFCYPDGGSTTHSAIHGAPDLADPPDMRLCSMQTWDDVTLHFPSAWNKLYRRELIEGLRFDTGSLWEDHTFFHRAATRTDRIAHMPRPLYLQTLGRDGQITTDDNDGVFQQFEVLDRVAEIWEQSGRPLSKSALARLASRLSFERSTSLRDPARRARFAAATNAFLTRHGLDWDASWDPELSPAWGLELTGTCPLSVVVPWDGQPAPLTTTLASLADQPPGGEELHLVISDPAHHAAAEAALRAAGLPHARIHLADQPGAGAARNAGLDQAGGAYVVFVDAGDVVIRGTFALWVLVMLRDEADFGFSQFRVGLGPINEIHRGFHDDLTPRPDPPGSVIMDMTPDRALALHSHPTAKIYRRAFLMEHGLRFGTGPLPDWQITLGAALLARRAVYLGWPGVESGEEPEARRQWHSPASMHTLARLMIGMTAALPPGTTDALPPGWPRRLLARAAWEKISFAESTKWGRQWRKLGLALAARRPGLGDRDTALDSYIYRDLARLIRGR